MGKYNFDCFRLDIPAIYASMLVVTTKTMDSAVRRGSVLWGSVLGKCTTIKFREPQCSVVVYLGEDSGFSFVLHAKGT